MSGIYISLDLSHFSRQCWWNSIIAHHPANYLSFFLLIKNALYSLPTCQCGACENLRIQRQWVMCKYLLHLLEVHI